jgi:hypothetical protein
MFVFKECHPAKVSPDFARTWPGAAFWHGLC